LALPQRKTQQMTRFQTLILSAAMALGALTIQSGAAVADVKNIVLVHGANVDGSTWRDVYDLLTAEDYRVTVVQMPLTSTEDDLAAVQRNIDLQDGPMLLVGHSYGGVVISNVGVDPDVRGLVYVAAFQPDVGESGGALLASTPTEFTSDKLTVFEDGHYLIHEDAFVDVVGNGLSDEDATYVARSQAASNAAILAYETQSAAWAEKPSWSIVATLDRTIAPDLQRQMSKRARSTVVEIANGHMLPMTNPDEVAAVIQRAAEAVE
jgi:pimeloyl-ACP methyl ester carboxylesterase